MADNRPLVAIYTVVAGERDELALALMHNFCKESGWHAIAYVDKSFSSQAAWDILLDDIKQRKYYAVLTNLKAKGMTEYCERYGVHFSELYPEEMIGNVPMGRSTRICRGMT